MITKADKAKVREVLGARSRFVPEELVTDYLDLHDGDPVLAARELIAEFDSHYTLLEDDYADAF